jgi:hypothetical protein
MPLSINVGLSRKASKDYQSTGYSINVTAELDQSLLAKPEELQKQIDGLYEQAQSALDRQAVSPAQTEAPTRHASAPLPARSNGRQQQANRNGANGRGYRNGHTNGNENGRGGGSATDSQRRAIHAIATRIGVDPQLEARDIIGAELADLTIRQASELIDHLKSIGEPAGDSRR